ncbi:MAG: galactokinase [Bacteroidetes bacterium]|nr:galactokinase [Bacteroidota bacterium]
MESAVKQYSGKLINEYFRDYFLTPPDLTVSSPGRINLIGEHTDYNNGFVLPAAIDKSIEISIKKRTDNLIELFSVDKNEAFSVSIDRLNVSGLLWPDYIIGVVDELIKAGHKFTGFSAAVTGNIPIGAGLSSSAALECATVYALNELFGLGIDRMGMVKIAKLAENNFVGLQCGIMDMFASMMGKADNAIRLDCRSLDYEYFPLKICGYKIVLLDTQVKHSLASSEYNTRRNECFEGVRLIQQKYPSVQSLRDADEQMIEETITNPVIKKRCRFIVQENKRVTEGCKNLLAGDIYAFGKQMYASHAGLRDNYEVSCKELDFIADECSKEKDVVGARMMGGGFGGCVIAIIKEEAIEAIVKKISKEYKIKMGQELKVYITQLHKGTAAIN